MNKTRVNNKKRQRESYLYRRLSTSDGHYQDKYDNFILKEVKKNEKMSLFFRSF